MNIKSPLRYPGGKSRAIKQILPIVPSFDEYREPMVGGGSVFFALFQKYPNKRSCMKGELEKKKSSLITFSKCLLR